MVKDTELENWRKIITNSPFLKHTFCLKMVKFYLAIPKTMVKNVKNFSLQDEFTFNQKGYGEAGGENRRGFQTKNQTIDPDLLLSQVSYFSLQNLNFLF